jgi:hypothetical protein
MKKIIEKGCFLVGAIFIAMLATVNAGTIEFTTDEGYVSGNLWEQDPDSGYKWKVTSSDYVVDVADGGTLTATAETNTSCYATRYKKPLTSVAGTYLFVSCDFRFKGFDVTTKPADHNARQRVTVIDLGFNPNSSWDTVCSGVISTFEWMAAGTYGYQVSPTLSGGGNSGSYSAASLGLTEEGGTMSDLLRVSISTTVAVSGNSTYTLKLDNLDGGTNIVTFSQTADFSSYDNLYFGVSGSNSKLCATTWTAENVYFQDPPIKGTVILVD